MGGHTHLARKFANSQKQEGDRKESEQEDEGDVTSDRTEKHEGRDHEPYEH